MHLYHGGTPCPVDLGIRVEPHAPEPAVASSVYANRDHVAGSVKLIVSSVMAPGAVQITAGALESGAPAQA